MEIVDNNFDITNRNDVLRAIDKAKVPLFQ